MNNGMTAASPKYILIADQQNLLPGEEGYNETLVQSLKSAG